MRRTFFTALALVAVAGCGGATSSSLNPASHQRAPRTMRSSVTTTTRARVKATVAPTTLAPTTVPRRSPPIARPVAAVAPTPPTPPPVTPPPTLAPPAPPAGVTASGAEGALVAHINSFRGAHGLSALAMHPELVRKAESWALYMANGGCGRGGNGLPNICHSVLSAGITVQWTGLAENVGMVSPSTNVTSMHNAFVNSPAHAANMLNGTMKYVGVGIATVGNYMYAAEVFMAT
jgi:uncharacterized protein YkwD